MAPPCRPGLTIIVQKAPPDDPTVVLIWTAVPVEHCTPEMLSFRDAADPLRAEDNAWRGYYGLPYNDYPRHPAIRHWQAGGVVIFGYKSEEAARYAKDVLAGVYIARSGRIAVREPS
jgi:hypothetical protein